MASKTDNEIFDAVSPYEFEANGQKQTRWLRLGRAFPNTAGGFNVRLRAIPAAVNGEVVIVITKRDPKEHADD